jgi:hypothetical protein
VLFFKKITNIKKIDEYLVEKIKNKINLKKNNRMHLCILKKKIQDSLFLSTNKMLSKSRGWFCSNFKILGHPRKHL